MNSTEKITHKDTKLKTKRPSQYHVVMHNDDVTTMEFVVMVLVTIFHKTQKDAEAVMLSVHHNGSAVAGTYYKDIALSKANYAMALARQNSFPLLLTIEEA